VSNGGSWTYTLGCVLIPILRWTDSLDYFVNPRRNLKSTYGLKMSQEVKANHLVGIKSAYRDLGLGRAGSRHLPAAYRCLCAILQRRRSDSCA
jgi:hypothetical protein